MLYRLCTLLAWLLLAASGMGWWFQLSSPVDIQRAPALAPDARPIIADAAQLQRLLGLRKSASNAPAPLGASRYRLVGVVAEGNHAGAVLIAQGDQPARVYRVGMELAPGLQVLRLQSRAVDLGPAGGPAVQTLQLPTPQSPPTGNSAPDQPGN